MWNFAVIGICLPLSLGWIVIIALFGYEIWMAIDYLYKQIQKKIKKMKKNNGVDAIYLFFSEIVEIIIQGVMIFCMEKSIGTTLIERSTIFFIVMCCFCAIQLFLIFLICTDKV